MEAHQESSVDDLIDAFMAKNSNWINEEAEELLRSLDFEVAWKVVDFGSMYGCRDSVAIVKTRIKDAKAQGIESCATAKLTKQENKKSVSCSEAGLAKLSKLSKWPKLLKIVRPEKKSGKDSEVTDLGKEGKEEKEKAKV
jgi:hypothetical protein